MTRPTFFIIGAPRCGTTALYRYLEQHRFIFMPPTKECHYFADDYSAFRRVRTWSDYLAMFSGAPRNVTSVGEASVYYLASSVAVHNILAFDPAARLIVMLRNPIDMLYSLHGQLCATFHENVADFEEAWGLQEERRRGQRIPKNCLLPQCLQYETMGKLGEQIQKLLRIAPHRQVHTIVFDDFVQNTRAAYNGVLSFLGVDSDARQDFPRINENVAWRSNRFGMAWNLMRRRCAPLREAVRRMVGPERYGKVARSFSKKVTKETVRISQTPAFRNRLVEVFRDDVGLLSDQLGRDLTHWLQKTAS